MTKKIKKTVTILSIVFLNGLMSFAGTTQPWKNIKVDVNANGTVSSTINLKEIENGFQRLTISLSNNSNKPITIQKITVSIPIEAQLSDNLDRMWLDTGLLHLSRHQLQSLIRWHWMPSWQSHCPKGVTATECRQ